jgi:hypothetical protein
MGEKSKGKFLLASIKVVTIDGFDHLFMYIHDNFNLISLFTVVAYIIFSLTSRQRGLQYQLFVSTVMRLNTRCHSDEGNL